MYLHTEMCVNNTPGYLIWRSKTDIIKTKTQYTHMLLNTYICFFLFLTHAFLTKNMCMRKRRKQEIYICW